jgi:phytoene synthase
MVIREQSATFAGLPQIKAQIGIASAHDYAFCRQIMREASKNYSTASNFLPPDKLHHVEALYALMRVGDDRVDVSFHGFESPLAAIDDWERSYWHVFETGDSPDPVMRAYLNTAVEYGIPGETMTAYFRAMKDDLRITRFATFEDLMYYMEGSAIPVGRAMTYILGTRPPYTMQDALAGADSLSIAMQLSNFWRDIGQDFESIGRIYLPQEDMQRFDYTETDVAARRINTNFIKLLEFQFERAERYYTHARDSVKMLASGQWGVMSGLEIYRAILFSIRRNKYDVFTRRAGTSPVQKLGLVAKAGWHVRAKRANHPTHP